MARLRVGNDTIGDGRPVYIIAEAADSHLGDMGIAKRMIREAKAAGADCIKFQHHLPEEEMLKDIPMSDNFEEPLYDFLKKNALNITQHKELMDFCRKVGITYLCTPFSYAAAKELKSIGLKTFKIGSGEFTDLTSLKAIAALGNPMLLSSGMCTLPEMRRTYRSMKAWGARFALLDCISEYPPEYDDMNLMFIQAMKKEFPDIVIGHSDHTPDLFTCFASVALGAQIIEKHVTLDKKRKGPDQSVSIDMQDLAELVEGIRKIERGLGHEKRVHAREKQIRRWAFRSIVSTRDIPKGSTLAKEMLWTKRPGTGIPSHELPQIIGRKAKRFIRANSLLRRQDVQ